MLGKQEKSCLIQYIKVLLLQIVNLQQETHGNMCTVCIVPCLFLCTDALRYSPGHGTPCLNGYPCLISGIENHTLFTNTGLKTPPLLAKAGIFPLFLLIKCTLSSDFKEWI